MSISNPDNKNGHIRSEKLHPDIAMANWSKNYLMPRKILWKTDLDIILRTNKECLMLIEVKKFGSPIKRWQDRTFKILDSILNESNGKEFQIKGDFACTLKYYGFHYLEINGDAPDVSSEIKWDGQVIDHETLINILQFGNKCKSCFDEPENCNCQ